MVCGVCVLLHAGLIVCGLLGCVWHVCGDACGIVGLCLVCFML